MDEIINYREVKASERLPEEEGKSMIIENNNQDLIWAWWVPVSGVWEDADECQYGPQEITVWLEPIPEITKVEIIEKIESAFYGYADVTRRASIASTAIIKLMEGKK